MIERCRTGECRRKTKETEISASLRLDGGPVEVYTGIGFFDHMLEAFAVHAGFGLKLQAAGDLQVDGHHTVEDTGIVLGCALQKALGDKGGIARFGSFYLPMDESLAFAAVDVSGRPFLVFDARFREERVGEYDTCLTPEFFRALAFNAGITLHMRVEYGDNAHHMIEALYKAAGHALRLAVHPRTGGVLSTKGTL
ncbi:MAG: imidazoleglycerol-phosphate dehydratase HisB [Clostridiales bacterium]|jgi:imidazoleglycerol-phosphate dehydratase|nr:imidazoleglycerol-phosphate dehydratase HisB [Clostridiales bacterium]